MYYVYMLNGQVIIIKGCIKYTEYRCIKYSNKTYFCKVCKLCKFFAWVMFRPVKLPLWQTDVYSLCTFLVPRQIMKKVAVIHALEQKYFHHLKSQFDWKNCWKGSCFTLKSIDVTTDMLLFLDGCGLSRNRAPSNFLVVCAIFEVNKLDVNCSRVQYVPVSFLACI